MHNLDVIISGFCFGVAATLIARLLLDSYVERYKRKHRQYPYDREKDWL